MTEAFMPSEIQFSPKRRRPVNLNLMTIRQPVTAIVSILHRFSGVVLFLAVPLLLWVFSLSLSSPDGFALVHVWFSKFFIKLTIFLVLSALIYHGLAGIRHFVMDWGAAESLKGGKITAWMTIVLSLVFSVFLGVWLW
jgi:succinate dehydrogenase / fumarate reductase cytochrome b subunit